MPELSIAFILGVLPLAISTGAGASSRHAIGTNVMGGMLGASHARRAVRAGVLRRRTPADRRQERWQCR